LRKRNFYVSKPYCRLDEFDKQGRVTNVNITSKDNLKWMSDSIAKYSNL